MRPDWCDPKDAEAGYRGVFLREGNLVLDVLTMTPGHNYAVVKWGEDWWVRLEPRPQRKIVWTPRVTVGEKAEKV